MTFKTLHDAALAQCADLKDRFVIMDVHGDGVSLSDPNGNLLNAVGNFRNAGIGANNLKYGAAYAPNIDTVLDFHYDDTTVDVTITTNGTAAPAVKLDTLKNSNNRVYEQAKAAIRDTTCKMPPSSAMAGVYAAVDNSRGVWKAPANLSVNSVIQPSIQFSNVEQDQMNLDPVAGKSVNAIRSFTGKGIVSGFGHPLPEGEGMSEGAGNNHEEIPCSQPHASPTLSSARPPMGCRHRSSLPARPAC